MRKLLTIIAAFVAAVAIAAPAMAQNYPLYVTGDAGMDNWSAHGYVMTGTPGGIWTVGLQLPVGRHEFKITEGDWSWNVPGANSWLTTDGSGNVTITYDQNTYADGWSPAQGRIGVSVDPGAWTAVGDWQHLVSPGDWNNAEPLTAMLSLGGGVYEYSASLAPGTYQFKAVNTGSWDAVGTDTRNVNAGTLLFTTTLADPIANMYVNPLTGVIKVDVVPEPSSIALVVMGLLGGLAIRRRKV